jgi:HSP20 family protein
MFSLIPWKKSGNDRGSVSAEPAHQLARLRQEFDSLLDRFWSGWPSLGGDWFAEHGGWRLGVNEDDREYLVRAEAPGFDVGDFDVQIRGNHLVIRAEHKVERQEGAGSAYHYGTFYRSIPIPQGVEADKIDARYRNGVLELRLPKGEGARGKRIAVKQD